MYKYLSTLTIFISAFLIFQIQPMLSKQLLPQFGGGASIWSASLVFYQVMLLIGYFYAHNMGRFHIKLQVVTHIVLVTCATLIVVTKFAAPNLTKWPPTLAVFVNLFIEIGPIFILLSATSILLQRWYVQTASAQVPYHWYSISNLGSLLALMSYPLVYELLFSLEQQTTYWLFGLISYCLLLTLLVIFLLKKTPDISRAPIQTRHITVLKGKGQWLLLSALSSAMLVSTTHMISTNIPPMPLLWSLPFVIYLLTFSYTFANKANYQRHKWAYAFIFSAFAGLLMFYFGSLFNALAQLIIYSLILFIACMICHGELRSKAPENEQFTIFYFYIALGGVLGSLFSTLIAPLLFVQIDEYLLTLAVIFSFVCYYQIKAKTKTKQLKFTLAINSVTWLACYCFLAVNFNQYNVATSRNFYGYLAVKDINTQSIKERRLIDGTTIHDSEPLNANQQFGQSYYHQHTGVAKSLAILKQHSALNIGVIGLGAGVLARFADQQDSIHFFELNPAVVEMAKRYFSYLENSEAKLKVTLGDGRIALKNNASEIFDVLIIDAFSSDVIPAHLLTQEAISLYWQRLNENGVLIVHISNNHIDLLPVLQAHSQHFNKAMLKFSYQGHSPSDIGSDWVVLTDNQAFLNRVSISDLSPIKRYPHSELAMWTDSKHSLLPLLKF
ncbi:spermidine synthase [Pseudoalteromonas sp. 68 DY56-GL68]|uniref:spermidine synthase n=1 Tax=Pseudoalteromonas sp. 68 DY56-GL68 TaxID=2974919 RepID=UPI00352B2F12